MQDEQQQQMQHEQKMQHQEDDLVSGQQKSRGGRHDHKKMWTPEEDALLFLRFMETPKRWGAIAKSMPGRTPQMVRNRWMRLYPSPETAQKHGLPKNICRSCGFRKRSAQGGAHSCPTTSPVVAKDPNQPCADPTLQDAAALFFPLLLSN